MGHVHGERRLPHAADARQRRYGHDPALLGGGGGQDVAQFVHEGDAAGEVGDRGRELGGTDRGCRGLRGRGGRLCEARVRLKYPMLEFLQARPRVHSQFVGQQTPRVRVHGQGLRLPPAPVQREHQQLAQALPERMRGRECGQLRHGLRVAALLQVHVEAGFEELEPQLLQPRTLGLRERTRHARQRLPVPQAQRAPQHLTGVAEIPGAAGLLGVGREFLGLREVERPAGAGQPDRVAARLADQDLGAQRLLQP